MKNVLDLFNLNKDVQNFNKIVKKSNYNLYIKNSSENHNYLLASSLFSNNKNIVFYVSSNVYKATKAYDTFVKILGVDNVNIYVNNEIVATEVDATNKEFLFERLSTIKNIIKNNKTLIVTDINSISKELMPYNVLLNNILKIKVNSLINRKSIANTLIKIGYHKVPTTNAVGDFSVRGEVIDIFPINNDMPVRIDLFDDEVESIKLFDKSTQISIKNDKLNSIEIYPNTELIFDNPKDIVSAIKEKKDDYIINQDKLDISNYNYTERLSKYLHYMYKRTESVLEYVENKTIIFEDINYLKTSYEKSIEELHYYLSNKNIYEGLDLAFYFDFYCGFDNNKVIITSEYAHDDCKIKLSDCEVIDIKGYSVVNYQNNVKLLLEEISRNLNKYILVFSKQENYNLMKEILDSNGIEYSNNEIKNEKVSLLLSNNCISYGFYNDITVIDESSIYKKMNYKTTKYRSTYESSSLINSKDDLKPGDYVVHYDYGIGQYLGIKVKQTGEYINDYINIKFANVELFIPVENINMLEKYEAQEGFVPKLTNIGTDEWAKKKKRIKEKLESIAKDLLLLQAYRETKTGFKYELDSDIQTSFENDFEFIETKDQQQAIDAIKKDMEEGRIVDRLVCGDVGYGKTEVAIRVAMKTILSGKQVAYLAPTTILTRQHYFTFKDRMEKYGVKVALMNRLISPKEKKREIEDLKEGKIDVIVGTHALLNDDVKYKDLGLLIVDEEQRFGVVHKEKIKQYKNNINVVTLTATPIPRTLQMSIMGARQMSLMETSPANRYPIQTYVLEQNDAIVREAIYNELGRGGQVFYMHNKVLDIEAVYNKLHKLVPEARIIIAHGQMTKIQLENAIQSFIDHEYDLLLCTTIIETGIDIPNTNTLIVEMADRLGLSQMYQIRGRVGRTNRVSYAYFMYEHSTVLTSEGEKRLQALKEFTSLGSGYKIAMRDLAIRGAGDFLGKEQSGYIDAIGMDLYMKLLNESIDEIKGIVKEDKKENIAHIEISKHIDDTYVSDDDIKIHIHKTIHSIDSLQAKQRVINELTDRFGKLNNEILLYINKQYLDYLVNKLQIEEISENEFKVKIVFSKEKSNTIGGKKMMELAYNLGSDFNVEYKNKRFYIYIVKLLEQKNWIYKAIDFLEELI